MSYQSAQGEGEPQQTPEQSPRNVTHSLTEQERARLIQETGKSGGPGEGDSSATKAKAAREPEPLPSEEESKDQESG